MAYASEVLQARTSAMCNVQLNKQQPLALLFWRLWDVVRPFSMKHCPLGDLIMVIRACLPTLRPYGYPEGGQGSGIMGLEYKQYWAKSMLDAW